MLLRAPLPAANAFGSAQAHGGWPLCQPVPSVPAAAAHHHRRGGDRRAVASAVHALIIVAAVLGGLALVGVVTFAAVRARRSLARGLAPPPLPAPPRWQAVQHDQRQAIGQAPEVHVHHHWHGVSAEEIAAILDRQNGYDHG